jgi:hypothetical protein
LIECQSCHTLNPDAERSCLACGTALPRAAATGGGSPGSARCPNGHPIDPTWRSCPYCERQQTGTGTLPGVSLGSLTGGAPAEPRRTRLEDPASPARPAVERRTRLEGEAAWPEPSPAPPSPSTPRPTRLEEPEPAARRTVLHEAQAAPPPPPPVPTEPLRAPAAAADRNAPARRLVAVLAAPDLGSGGAVFPVRSGKNSIGADRGSDILLAGDTEVSSEHALILHRNGTFHLADRLSTNGTWLNGEEVPANGTVPLRDRDRIRCGRTELLFLTIETAGASVA